MQDERFLDESSEHPLVHFGVSRRHMGAHLSALPFSASAPEFLRLLLNEDED